MFPKMDNRSEESAFITDAKGLQIIQCKVPGTNFFYKFEITNTIPIMSPMPISNEIFHRLILKAIRSCDLWNFNLVVT